MGLLLFFGCSALVVRLFRIIGRPHKMTPAACPILSHYRTSSCIPLSVASQKRLHQNDATLCFLLIQIPIPS